MTAPAIVHATRADAAEVAALIAAAFQVLDVTAWLVEDPTERRRVLARNFAIYVEHAFTHGEIHLTADRHAVAVWFDRTGPVPEPPDYERRLAAACDPYTDRFHTLDSLFETNHPTEPHHHLAFLAVSPDRQGTGLGTALLRHHHRRLDAAAVPAYLEASSTRSRSLYLRHAYRPSPPFRLPDGPPLWPMWREPRPIDAR